MDINSIKITDKINSNENGFIVFEELTEHIKNQFEFINIGINYIDEYGDDVPNEIYDWLLQEINSNYLEINEINTIYKDFNRLKLVSKSLYELLFVDILEFEEFINLDNSVIQLRRLVSEKLKSLKVINIDSENGDINLQLLKWSISSDALDGNLEMLEENYWPLLIEYLETKKL